MKNYLITRITSFCAVTAAVITCCAGGAQGKGREPAGASLTIERAVRMALVNNPDLKASDARREAAAGRAGQARLWQNPELELSVEDMPAKSSGWARSKHMAGISQSIPYPGKKRLDNEIGMAGVMAGEAGWRAHQAELARDVKIAFYRALTAEHAAKVAEDLVALAEYSAETSKKRADAGDSALQEQLRAEIQMEQAKTAHSEALEKIAETRRSLALLLGVPSAFNSSLSGVLDDSGSSSALNRGPDAWLDSHPAMVAARAKSRLAGATVRRAEIDHMPDPKVGISAGRDEAVNENLVELRLSIPLPFLDKGKSKIRESVAGAREADAELVATEQRLLAEWGSVRARFKAAASQVAVHRERVLPKSEQALALVKTGFEQGKFSFIDLLDTQRMTAEVRLSYQKKLFELNAARAELESFVDPMSAKQNHSSYNLTY